MGSALTARRLFRAHRLDLVRPSLRTICLRHSHRLGAQHYRQPSRQLRRATACRRRRPKLGRRLSLPGHLDTRQCNSRLATARARVSNRWRRRHGRRQHPHAAASGIGGARAGPGGGHDQLPRQHLQLPQCGGLGQ